MKLLKWLAIGFGVLILGFIGLVIIGLTLGDSAGKRANPDGNRELATPATAPAGSDSNSINNEENGNATEIPMISADQLAKAYDENTVAADMLYKGKKLKAYGKIAEINTDFMGSPYIVLAAENRFIAPQFKFDKRNLDAIARLKKGDDIMLLCTGKGDVAKTPMSGDCSIL
ncbi:hypothetical protein VDP97_16800 [Xanthomonas campestris pv. campestris]|uniref:OB-fold protein n=2 Tax=Xanthomonas TaxID=338 RepID=UPI0023675F8A|nr:hypothetical protein [Xanthomonas campestris]MDM7703407.1 hypothetical protein [Xanthomonas campestris pv. campestris]MEA0858480.1 hypothetical protein [Xanthomonas campestris pv. campestris]MEA0924481.1 hypothetical protein [Xanthomonas campestris pv. campestris]MEA9726808.1 hypothetical protein [Xanthomonas campestris pv. raphani]MEA9911896.1 hypothetical protein [Xanthomonas campestris pv. raphani]